MPQKLGFSALLNQGILNFVQFLDVQVVCPLKNGTTLITLNSSSKSAMLYFNVKRAKE